jgi:hypothetical protein
MIQPVILFRPTFHGTRFKTPQPLRIDFQIA